MLEQGSPMLAADVFSSVIEQVAVNCPVFEPYCVDRCVQAPEWAEAWNKRSIAHFLAGEHDKSLEDIKEVLRLEPRHFGALCGRGKVNERQCNWQKAIDSYQAALVLHPWLATVGSSIHFARLESKAAILSAEEEEK